jgi:type VII secretion-associated serine protease mycosin
MSIESAWTCARGAGTTVAVVDSGVRGTHPDLDGRVSAGASVLDLSPVVVGDGDVDPAGHVTHVAGIVAAGAGNGIGTEGVAPEASILPVRVLDATGTGYDTDVATGIVWATDHGADVINLSLVQPDPSTALETAVTYAVSHDVVVVAAAGNDGPTGPASYPAADDDTITVASYQQDGAISPFSTAGAYVDVAAPGTSILSTLNDGGWGYKSGTSMATPQVAGTVALMRSEHPTETAAQIRAHLLATADDAGAPGVDPSFGWGRVDPARAVR